MRGMLMRGFTTVRDAAGADFGLQEAVERGLFDGPRLYIAGHPISQTGGHADMPPRAWAARGSDDLQLRRPRPDRRHRRRRRRGARAVREQVRNGANQIKIMAGGGIASPTDPIDGTQYSLDELRGDRARRPRRRTPM